MKRFINPVPQFLKSNGDLNSAGKIYFLQEGSDTLTDTKAIYLDPEGLNQSINPVTLSDQGRMPNVFGEGKYRAKLYDSAGILQWTRDIDFDAESAQFEDWNSQVTYGEKAITRGSDGEYYISEVPNNKGNDPTVGASAQYWSKVAILEFFNEDKPGGYPDNAIVILNGRLYASNIAGNTNTPPHASWDDLSFNNAVTGAFSATGTISSSTGFSGPGFVSAYKAIKTSNQTVTSSTTLVDATDMSIVLENGVSYHVRAHIRCSFGLTTSNGIKVSFTGAAVYSWLWLSNTNSSTSNADPTANASGGALQFTKSPNSVSGADEVIIFDGIVVGTGSAFKMQFAQASSFATATTLGQYTIMIATRL